jgi:hypothetical protein
MLLTVILTYRVGPVMHVDLLSHFSHICSGKNKKQRFFFEYIYAKLICRTDLLCDQPVFEVPSEPGRTICGSSNSSELVITARALD